MREADVHESGVEGAYGSGRMSRQRLLIARVAASMPGAFTIDALCSAVRENDGSTGVATVYRAVAVLLTEGWLERVGERDGHALLARCPVGPRHHHHVVCDECGRVEATECPVVEAPGHATSASFVITRHEVTLYGLCPQCAAEASAEGVR